MSKVVVKCNLRLKISLSDLAARGLGEGGGDFVLWHFLRHKFFRRPLPCDVTPGTDVMDSNIDGMYVVALSVTQSSHSLQWKHVGKYFKELCNQNIYLFNCCSNIYIHCWQQVCSLRHWDEEAHRYKVPGSTASSLTLNILPVIRKV